MTAMNVRYQVLRARYEAEGDVEALRNMDRAERRAAVMRNGRLAEVLATVIAVAIAAADLVQVDFSWADGLTVNLAHVVEATHHALWIPLFLVSVVAFQYRRQLRDCDT